VVFRSTRESQHGDSGCLNFKLPSRLDKRKTKQQAKDLGQFGQRLFELLTKEPDARFNRNKALTILEKILREYNQNSNSIEKHIKQLLSDQEKSVSELQNFVESLQEKKTLLTDQIRDKSLELERNEKKLRSLTSVKPVYVEELEAQQDILSKLFVIYSEKTRNLDYLENQFDQVSQKLTTVEHPRSSKERGIIELFTENAEIVEGQGRSNV
jgi:clusterin-associated protein 1